MRKQTFITSPLRLSLFGGGTDIPFIYKKLGKGISITASLDLSVTVGCTTLPFYKGIKLKYSNSEQGDDIDSLIHPIFKEALKHFRFNLDDFSGIELISTASVPSGSGLGSSAAFTCSLAQCLSYHLYNKILDEKELLMLATNIEHLSGNDQIGYQDQVASIYGGIKLARYSENNIEIEKPSIQWENGIIKLIESRGYLYKTSSRKGISSNYIHNKSLGKNIEKYNSILELTEQVDIFKNEFDQDKIINLLKEASFISQSIKTSTSEINAIQNQLMSLGAIYCKQLGAGGGGFIFCIFDTDTPVIPDEMMSMMIRPKINKKGTSLFLNA